MSLYYELGINDCETVSDVIQEISEETGVDEEELWTLTTELLLNETFLENAKNESRLRLLFMLHLNSSVNDWDYTGEPPAKWVEITIPVDGEENSDFIFSYGAFNVPVQKDGERIEEMKKLAEDEGLEIGHQDEGVVFTEHQEYDSLRAIQLTGRILDEVYGLDFSDVIWAEKVIPGLEDAATTWDDL